MSTDISAIEQRNLHNALMKASISYRLAHSNVRIDGNQPLDFSRYPYIPEIIDERSWQRVTILKGAQMGFTIACIMKALEFAKEGGLRGIGYFFPSDSEVSDFAKARFGPMMTNNPEVWGNLVHDTDSAALKRVGDTFLYFRGAGQKGTGTSQKSLSKQKSIPLDVLVLDERDEMDDNRVDAIMHRLDGSLHPHVISLSTPTLPGYGVDYDYARSDQRVWMWKCQACGEWTCLELTFPDCIAEPSGNEPYYMCQKCRGPLAKVVGEWVARKTDIQDHAGYWVGQLSSPTRTARDIIEAVEMATETGRKRELENQTFARAYADVDEEITEQMLDLLLTNTQKPLRHEGPCAMGVDPGKPLWYEVAARVTEVDSEVVARGRASSYEEIDRIATAFNVKCGVMDQGYDPSAVSKFCEDHPGWFGCLYVGGKKTAPDWDHTEHLVKVGRTRILDDAHNAIIKKRIKHYQKDEFWVKHYVPQMTNLKRATIEKNARTQDAEAVWVVTGKQKNDHLRHADAYCQLALTQVGLAKSIQRMRNRQSYRDPSRPKSPWVM